jgi:CheY-like chemotaxis protein
MNIRPNLLVVDDEVMNQNIILDLLEDEFEVEFVCNGKECIDSVEHSRPDLILLDVNMPILNGLDTCKHLRKERQFEDLPIIFISALASAQERLAGYQAGGDDYLTKPFEEDELKAKISLLLKVENDKNKSKEEIRNAMGTAKKALTSSDELGAVFHFMKSLLTENNLNAILALVKDALSSFNLEACIMLAHTMPSVYFSTNNKIRPIEQDVLREMHHAGEVIEFSNRAIFNSEHAAILVKEFPEDEDIKLRYKEHINIIIDALEEKLKQRVADFKQQQHFRLLENTIKVVAQRLKEAKKLSHQHREKNTKILGILSGDMEDSFTKLDLREDDEKLLRQQILATESKLDKVYDDGKQTEHVFDEIIKELCHLLQLRMPVSDQK